MNDAEKTRDQLLNELVGLRQRADDLEQALQRTQQLHTQDFTALRQSEERLSLALEAIHMVTWEWDIQSGQIVWSEYLESLLGLGRDSFGGSPEAFLASVFPEDRELVVQLIDRDLEKDADYDIEFRLVWPNQTIHWVRAQGRFFFDSTGQAVRMLGVLMDISQHKYLETQLRQAQKMEAVGQLTAGIAHNLNNALQVITGNLDVLLMEAPESFQPMLEDINEAGQRAAAVIKKLMLFSRRSSNRDHVPIELSALIRSTVDMCRTSFGHKIEIGITTWEGLPSVLGEHTQLEQVFLNLCINARDALEDGDNPSPTIQIAVDTIDLPPRDERLPNPNCPGLYLRVQVIDNGIGMAAETLQHIFEPFFTTKDVGRGTGLGLATAYGIIEQHGGWITGESKPGVETTFSVYLPAIKQIAGAQQAEEQVVITGGTETILIIEDEEAVRRFAARVLERYGYAVLEGVDGRDGLEVFQRDRNRVALVLLDLSMPRMSGREVFAELRALDPAVKIAIFTGGVINKEDLVGAEAIVKKPLGMNELLCTVREVLDRG